MRRRRRLKNGASYHVTAKINRGEFILKDDLFKQLFLDIVQRAKNKYAFTIRNFCIMDNHIHLIITPTGDASLSKIMQWILSVFAMNHNSILKIKGHVWYDRFTSKIIDSISQLLATFEYITNNPVTADMVKHPCEFKFNGINFIIKKDFSVISPPDETFVSYIRSLEDSAS